jgi:hypothetical protein
VKKEARTKEKAPRKVQGKKNRAKAIYFVAYIHTATSNGDVLKETHDNKERETGNNPCTRLINNAINRDLPVMQRSVLLFPRG